MQAQLPCTCTPLLTVQALVLPDERRHAQGWDGTGGGVAPKLPHFLVGGHHAQQRLNPCCHRTCRVQPDALCRRRNAAALHRQWAGDGACTQVVQGDTRRWQSSRVAMPAEVTDRGKAGYSVGRRAHRSAEVAGHDVRGSGSSGAAYWAAPAGRQPDPRARRRPRSPRNGSKAAPLSRKAICNGGAPQTPRYFQSSSPDAHHNPARNSRRSAIGFRIITSQSPGAVSTRERPLYFQAKEPQQSGPCSSIRQN